MIKLMKLNSDKFKESEYFIQFELYRILKDFILDHSRSKMRDKNWANRIKDVLVEVPVNGLRADIVITKENDIPLLVIETKRRTMSEGYSISCKMDKAKDYAYKLGSRYYAICNGWILILMSEARYPYLLGIYGVNIDYDYARKLLVGIVKYSEGESDSNMDILNSLPKVPDYYDIAKKILPAIARKRNQEDMLKTWKQRINA